MRNQFWWEPLSDGESGRETPDYGEWCRDTPDYGEWCRETPDYGERGIDTPDYGERCRETPDFGEEERKRDMLNCLWGRLWTTEVNLRYHPHHLTCFTSHRQVDVLHGVRATSAAGLRAKLLSESKVIIWEQSYYLSVRWQLPPVHQLFSSSGLAGKYIMMRFLPASH